MLENSQLKELQSKADLTDAIIKKLNEQISELTNTIKTTHLTKKVEILIAENKKLEKAVLSSKNELIKLQEKNGIEQIPLPDNNKTSEKLPKQKEKKNKANKEDKSKTVTGVKEIDFGRLDLRVGKIIAIDDHPNAEKLFIETIDLGEKEPRRIISGIRSYYSKDQLSQQKVICLCNLKPAKLRGEVSYGMLICATGENGSVEILQPPEQSKPGDIVVAAGNEHHPDKELIPSEKVFETIVKDLSVNANKTLTYKGDVVEVKGNVSGPITTKTLTCCTKVG